MVEELHRLSCENKRLSESLTHMWENYEAMQNQLSQLVNKKIEHQTQQSRKRKAEFESCINNTECSTNITEEESVIKRTSDTMNMITSPKVSKVLVKTEASNTSLVSFLISSFLQVISLYFLCIYKFMMKILRHICCPTKWVGYKLTMIIFNRHDKMRKMGHEMRGK